MIFVLLGGAILGSLGVIAGIWAEKFDQLAGFQNFIIIFRFHESFSFLFFKIHNFKLRIRKAHIRKFIFIN